VTDYELIRPHENRVVELGYGYSCLSEDTQSPEEDQATLFDMLRDWGWAGAGTPPAWLNGGAG
jgi:hypothetical protein